MFVSYAEAARTLAGSRVTLGMPERGIFAVVDGDNGGLLASALDSAARTSTTTDDIAEVLDGVHAELRERSGHVAPGSERRDPFARVDGGETASLALVVVEDDALAFFSIGDALALLVGPAYVRRATAVDEDARLGGAGALRFFRAYVRAGDVVLLLTADAWSGRSDFQLRGLVGKDLAKTASALVAGDNSRERAAAIVLRVDEEPRIR